MAAATYDLNRDNQLDNRVNYPRAISGTTFDPSGDAFGRLRISQPVSVFDWQAQYTLGSLLWDTTTASGGTATHEPLSASVKLTATNTNGSSVVRQTLQYHRYQPGKSQAILCTFVMDTDGDVALVQRTGVGGSPSDTVRVAQADWNIDPMDGTGVSGVTMDWSKGQILVIDLQWLGMGRVRVGWDVDGALYYCHEFNNANLRDNVYMTTANLPVRYEVSTAGTTTTRRVGYFEPSNGIFFEHTATAAATNDLHQVCCSVLSEGGQELERGYTFSSANAGTAIGVTTRRPILSIRPATTFNSLTNRIGMFLLGCDAVASGNSAYVELVYDGTLTNASFANVIGTYSGMQRDVSATAIAGGVTIDSFYVAASANNRSQVSRDILSRLPITLDAAGSAQRTLSVVATALSGTSTIAAALTWREIQ